MLSALKQTMTTHGLRQSDLARAVNLSPSTIAQLVNHGQWPKTIDHDILKAQIQKFFLTHNIKLEKSLFDVVPIPTPMPVETPIMMKLKERLVTKTYSHFGLNRDPFAPIRQPEDMFKTPDSREASFVMYQTARYGGFMALVGESGSGKSTLRREMVEKLRRDNAPVKVIVPYATQVTEEQDSKGTTLRSKHLAEAILSELAPLEKLKSSPEAQARQLKRVLMASAAAGNSHVLMIEEAHSLPIATLKHLKRFSEMEADGFGGELLSIILVGQPELMAKLDVNDASVREVVGRIDIVTLPPLGEHLEAYLKHRFERINKRFDDVFDMTALDALRVKLSYQKGKSAGSLYPLLINNVVSAALNLAARYGLPKVTADVIKEV